MGIGRGQSLTRMTFTCSRKSSMRRWHGFTCLRSELSSPSCRRSNQITSECHKELSKDRSNLRPTGTEHSPCFRLYLQKSCCTDDFDIGGNGDAGEAGTSGDPGAPTIRLSKQSYHEWR